MTKTKTTKTVITTLADLPPAKPEQSPPLRILATGEWLKGPMVTALRNKYGTDVEAGQRGADFLVAKGMVKVPTGCTLKCVANRKYGGSLGFVADDGSFGGKVTISGLPD